MDAVDRTHLQPNVWKTYVMKNQWKTYVMKNTKGFTYLILPHERNHIKAGL